MLSRVAEQLFWTARYLERAENTARLVQVHANLTMDLPNEIAIGWGGLLEITGNWELFNELDQEPSESAIGEFMLWSEQNPSSIFNCLRYARENLRVSRDIVPSECFEQVNDLFHFAAIHFTNRQNRRGRYEFLRQVILGVQTHVGLLSGTMSHDQAYEFVRMGRNLERADMTSRIVDVRSASLLQDNVEDLTPFETIQWMSVLKSLSGYQMYRRHVQLPISGNGVLGFVLKDESFPRAVYHCIKTVDRCLLTLPRHKPVIAKVRSLVEQVCHADVGALREQDRLHLYIDELQVGINAIQAQLDQVYFAPDQGA